MTEMTPAERLAKASELLSHVQSLLNTYFLSEISVNSFIRDYNTVCDEVILTSVDELEKNKSYLTDDLKGILGPIERNLAAYVNHANACSNKANTTEEQTKTTQVIINPTNNAPTTIVSGSQNKVANETLQTADSSFSSDDKKKEWSIYKIITGAAAIVALLAYFGIKFTFLADSQGTHNIETDEVFPSTSTLNESLKKDTQFLYGKADSINEYGQSISDLCSLITLYKKDIEKYTKNPVSPCVMYSEETRDTADASYTGYLTFRGKEKLKTIKTELEYIMHKNNIKVHHIQ